MKSEKAKSIIRAGEWMDDEEGTRVVYLQQALEAVEAAEREAEVRHRNDRDLLDSYAAEARAVDVYLGKYLSDNEVYPYPRRITEQAKRADTLIGELTRWNDPQMPPKHERRVIVKAVLPNRSEFVTGGWFAIENQPQGWSIDLDREFRNLEVVGWREIPE